jgi:predicted alpha-1,2-mannosidase
MKELLAITLLCCAILNTSLGQSSLGKKQSNVQFVNPLIGTAPSTTRSALAHGQGTENSAQVIPEVTSPFGMTNWTPQTRNVETKCVAPYYYNDTLISGFRGTHWLSGSCTQDYGSFTLMPVSGTLRCLPEVRGSHYSHKNEVSSPFYYRVDLEDYGIEGELTATTRCGYCRFTYSMSDTAFIVFEPNSDYGEGFVRIDLQKNEIVGYNPVHRIYQGWGEPAGFRGYFVARFSQPFESCGTYEGPAIRHGRTEISGQKRIGGFVRFLLRGKKSIVVKIGTSFTSIDQARKNLLRETANIDFDAAKDRLQTQWSNTLAKVRISGGSEEARMQFYTALYHSLLLPRVYNDCDGSYPSFAGGDSICQVKRGNYYCDFSLWDTYRALHPLLNLLIPETNADMVRSLLLKARQGGWLPIFPCWNSYTSAMIGDHAIAVIADAFVKDVIRLGDGDYEYLKKNATRVPADRKDYLNGKGVRALDSYMQYGFVPLDDSVKESFHKGEQVSRTLEYAYDDFALSQIAGKLGKKDDRQRFLARSANYKNVFDPALKCVCGRFADGTFTREFTKTKRMPYITEGSPWQYTWYVPHDIEGLIAMMGGRSEFNDSLDAFFATGQYWHGNEPGHQIPFLYNYSGAPWKTQKIVGQILRDEYSNTPGGLSGNDDTGQMSAWYVFAAMGLYPVCPSKDEYAVTSPAFEKVVVQLAGGKQLVIQADGVNAGKKFIGSIEFNGKPVTDFKMKHSELVKGGTLRFRMQEGFTPFVPLPQEGGR